MSTQSLEKNFTRHPLHYFILLCLQLVGLWGVFWFSTSQPLQFIMILYMATSYVVWGIIHHMSTRDLHIKIIAEYLLFGLMGVLLFSVLIFKP